MKKCKLFISLVLCLLVVTFITGCDNNKKNTNDNKKESTTVTEKDQNKNAKCSAIECIKKIDVEASVEDINKVMGFEGKLTDEKYNIYTWKINDKESVIAKYYSGNNPTIVIEFDEDKIANKKVDLSKLNDLKAKVKEGITYDEFKKEIGNQEGTLIEKSKSTNRYMWSNTKGGYVRASFNANSNKCTFFMGRA